MPLNATPLHQAFIFDALQHCERARASTQAQPVYDSAKDKAVLGRNLPARHCC